MADPIPSFPGEIHFGVFSVDLRAGEVRKRGVRVKLQERPFQVLAALLERPGQVVTREELRGRLWPDGTFVDFDHGVSSAVNRLREALGDCARSPRYIETLGGRGYRFVYPVPASMGGTAVSIDAGARHMHAGVTSMGAASSPAQPTPQGTWSSGPRQFAIAAVCLSVALALAAFWYPRHRVAPPRQRVTIVVADFDNQTGKAAFDGALKQWLVAQLEQSPLLNVLSDERMNATLRLMARPAGERRTEPLAREVCRRVGGAAVLVPSIRWVPNQYVIGLSASACSTGDSLGDEQARVNDQSQVLLALDNAAARLRTRFGESLASVQKYSTPVEQATTASLPALQAYSAALRVQNNEGHAAAVPLFRRAIELDPHFAMAYARLANCFGNLAESGLAAENARQAFALREHTSERERLYIEEHYHLFVTGDIEAANRVQQEWLEIYPGDDVVLGNLSVDYGFFGDHEKALAYARQGLDAAPTEAAAYVNVAQALLALNRFDEADAVLQRMREHNLDLEERAQLQYQIAFLQGDTARMQTLATEALRITGQGDVGLLPAQADTEAYYGRLRNARVLDRRAVQATLRLGDRENAAMWEADAALREAELGNRALARQHAAAALDMDRSRSLEPLAALALARAGAIGQAQHIAAELNRQFPSDTMLNSYWLPSIRAAMALQQGRAGQALEELEPATRYELGQVSPVANGTEYPVYLRGLALLSMDKPALAAAEFQKLLDHRGVAVNSTLAALARAQLARAFDRQGDSVKAGDVYQEFLTQWKDADADIPILQQAKAEYAKLK